VSVAGALLVTAPSTATADRVARCLRAVGSSGLGDPTAVRGALPAVDVLGPAWLAHAEPARFVPVRGDRPVERLAPDDAGLAALVAAVSEEDAGESAVDELTGDVFVTRDDGGDVVCAAGFLRWPGDVAHLSVLTAEPARGRGLATATASPAVAEALRQGLLPQWRARPEPSRRVAARQGLHELGWQLSLRLEDTAAPRGAV